MPGTTTEHEDVEMDSFAEDNTHCYAPPAHIAARFYRKSSARRKSSAHSSRRSSVSSRQSHQTALSCHGGPQSTHVAQHLRRASIIESRKARLADRAAHAEQVRLRAAIAKAAPRAVLREERALAAQAAREKLLAEITARCEEEVRRAKKVAEETREKKAAEHEKLKEGMAEKFAEAARRRSVYQNTFRRPRTTSLAAFEEKKVNLIHLRKMGENAAAKVIQRSWRSHRQRRTVADFLALDLSLASIKTREFEEVTKFISQDRVIEQTACLLKQLNLIDSDKDELGERGGVRVFLSTYMILGHPVQAFSHGGKEPQEQELMSKGEALLHAFEECLRQPKLYKAKLAPRSTEEENLTFLFNDFSSTFHAWRSQDLTVIIDVMVNSFVNLDLILQSTKDDHDGHVAEDYFVAVRQEQIKLLARLKKLAGPEEALSRVRVAVRRARKQRALKERKKSEQHVPRTSSTEDLSGDVVSSAPPASPTLPTSEATAPSYVSRLGQTMTVLPSNREIAHEIQINGIYEVQQQPWTDSRKHFMESLQSSMRDSMQKGGGETAANWAHAMAVLIKDKLLNLISQKHPLYDRIDGFLDPKLIDQQCRNGMFSYTTFFETIAGLIAQICSPGRDEAIKAFSADSSSDTIDRLFSLINIIDLMTLDHINFQFRMAASSVIEHGHQHEMSSFERDLADGVHNLEKTRRWWTSSRTSLVSPSTPSPLGNSIYTRGLVDLVLSNKQLRYNDLPETLQLDWIRLLTLRARAFHVIAASSILLTTKIRLRRNRESLWTRDAERLMALDLASCDTARIVSIIESSHMMPESTKEGLLDFVARVLPPAVAAYKTLATAEQARQTAIENHVVFDPSTLPDQYPTSNSPSASSSSSPSLPTSATDAFTEQVATFVLKSLRDHVYARLAASSTAEKVRITTGAAATLARAGMPEFVAEVEGLVGILERVRSVDLKAHGVWYEEAAAATTTGGTGVTTGSGASGAR